MRWDAAALYVAAARADGALDPPRHLAGGPAGSVNELRWRPTSGTGKPSGGRPTPPASAGAPAWIVGIRTIALEGPDGLLAVALRAGLSTLLRVDLATGESRTIFDAIPHLGALAARGGDVLAVVGGNGSGPAIVRIRTNGAVERLAGALPAGDYPAHLTFPTSDGETAAGFLHSPAGEGFAAPSGTLPPLVVVAHGGPTARASPLPSALVRFWTPRGYAVLDVNYRGSSGYGRRYRQALRGLWGVRDVADCVAGARHLAAVGRVRGDAMFIRGGSAGGYTVLQALCDHDVFRGGACHFGVSDPRSLTAETHKFEFRYDAFLFGEGEDFERATRERTPLDHPARIRVPVIFFQGLEDLAVLPSQTVRIHEALRARGLASECHLYAGEQHGFRRADTVRDVWTREAAFFRGLLAGPSQAAATA